MNCLMSLFRRLEGPQTVGRGPAFWGLFVLVLAVAIAYPLFSDGYTVGNTVYFFVWVFIALSLCLIWGYGGSLSFGQTAFFGVADYGYGILTINYGAAYGFTLIALLVIVWEAVARSGLVTRFTLPPFSLVCQRIWGDLLSGDLVQFLALTLWRALAGFAIAVVLGIAIGLATSRSPVAHWLFDPIISVGFPCPKIAFVPVIVLWLGFYDLAKITMVAVDDEGRPTSVPMLAPASEAQLRRHQEAELRKSARLALSPPTSRRPLRVPSRRFDAIRARPATGRRPLLQGRDSRARAASSTCSRQR